MEVPRFEILIGAGLLLGGSAVMAATVDGHVGRNAEKGDPARWYQPAGTPQQQHETAMKEAAAALAEGLRECRDTATERRQCEAEARSRYEDDVEHARGFLVRSTLG